MRDITDVILHKIMKTKSIFIYTYIYNRIEFKQIGFSSEVSFMYNRIRLQKGRTREKDEEVHSD